MCCQDYTLLNGLDFAFEIAIGTDLPSVQMVGDNSVVHSHRPDLVAPLAAAYLRLAILVYGHDVFIDLCCHNPPAQLRQRFIAVPFAAAFVSALRCCSGWYVDSDASRLVLLAVLSAGTDRCDAVAEFNIAFIERNGRFDAVQDSDSDC